LPSLTTSRIKIGSMTYGDNTGNLTAIKDNPTREESDRDFPAQKETQRRKEPQAHNAYVKSYLVPRKKHQLHRKGYRRLSRKERGERAAAPAGKSSHTSGTSPSLRGKPVLASRRHNQFQKTRPSSRRWEEKKGETVAPAKLSAVEGELVKDVNHTTTEGNCAYWENHQGTSPRVARNRRGKEREEERAVRHEKEGRAGAAVNLAMLHNIDLHFKEKEVQ